MGRELEAVLGNDMFIRVPDLLTADFYLKLEFLNPARSIAFKTAIGLIRSCEAAGLIKRNTVLVESSSGDLGVALAMICSERGYRFKCIVGSSANASDVSVMKAFGAEVTSISTNACNDGYPDPRLQHILDLTSRDARYVWTTRYGNEASPAIHAELTAPAIANRFPRIDYLFIDAGNTGALIGCAGYFSRRRPETKIIAVNDMGAGISPDSMRSCGVPGMMASGTPPPDHSAIYATVSVPELAAVSSCRYLASSYGILTGASTGAVMTAVLSWRGKFHQGEVVVAIAPDSGERYLATIYNDEWVVATFGADVLLPELYTRFVEGCVTSFGARIARREIAYA